MHAQGREVGSIFFGGGTPSLFPPGEIARVIDAAAAALDLAGDCEITLEANPGAAEHDDFAGYRAAGVNRLSLGIQSFDDGALRALGRIHDGAEAAAAVDAAVRAGFERLNLDLMHGLPGQTADAAVDDIERALAYRTGHVSHYQLTIEPNTPFHHHPPELPDEDTLAAIQDACHAHLAAAGYHRYEISAWARPGHACRHNLNYWRFGDYIGIGAGAHGKLTTPGGQVTRRWKHRHPGAYLAAAAHGGFCSGASQPGAAERTFEFMLNALRLDEGFTEDAFCALTGNGAAELRAVMTRPAARGLVERTGGLWRPTALGQRFLNDLQAMCLPPD